MMLATSKDVFKIKTCRNLFKYYPYHYHYHHHYHFVIIIIVIIIIITDEKFGS